MNYVYSVYVSCHFARRRRQMGIQKSDDTTRVRRAAVLSVSTETAEMTDPETGRSGYITDVKVWAALAPAREPTQLRWDPIKQRFDLPPDIEPEPEPEELEDEEKHEEEEEKEEDEEEEEHEEPAEEAPPAEAPPEKEKKQKPPPPPKKPVPKKKKRKKKKRRRNPYPDGDPTIVYAKPRQMKKQ